MTFSFAKRNHFSSFNVINIGTFSKFYQMLNRSIFIFGSQWSEVYIFYQSFQSKVAFTIHLQHFWNTKRSSPRLLLLVEVGRSIDFAAAPHYNHISVCNTRNVFSKRAKVKPLSSKYENYCIRIRVSGRCAEIKQTFSSTDHKHRHFVKSVVIL